MGWKTVHTPFSHSRCIPVLGMNPVQICNSFLVWSLSGRSRREGMLRHGLIPKWARMLADLIGRKSPNQPWVSGRFVGISSILAIAKKPSVPHFFLDFWLLICYNIRTTGEIILASLSPLRVIALWNKERLIRCFLSFGFLRGFTIKKNPIPKAFGGGLARSSIGTLQSMSWTVKR